ncbi:MAG TPA: PilZ domain-containing protein [Bacteriovoracaceae bacterium]|nr:PilZ domain-containing protein [Bacteriovoracaceae bacterium]
MTNWSPRELSTDELYETLHKACDFGGMVERPLIFSRDQFQISHLEIKGNELIISLQDEIENLEETRHLCVDLKYRKMSFILKKSDYQIEGNIIRAKIPTQAKAIIKRPYPRYKLDFKSYPSSITRAERRGGQYELKGYVDNLSLNGLCLLINKTEDGDELKSNDHIWIKSFASKSLPVHIFGKVIYTTAVIIDGVEFLKAGIRLEKEFEEEFFNSLIEDHLQILAA